jgi:hypothetical protein
MSNDGHKEGFDYIPKEVEAWIIVLFWATTPTTTTRKSKYTCTMSSVPYCFNHSKWGVK